MKAISPALPMAAPSRQLNGADALATDDVFSALIAAVIGAPVAGSAPPAASSSSSPSATRTDKADDARPADAASRSTRSTGEATDATGAAKSSDEAAPADATRAGRRSPTNPTTEHGATSKSASPASAPTAQPTTASTTEPKVSAGLEKAAVALADALAASKGDAAKANPANARPTNVGAAMTLAAKPGSALTEGQLPAQLVAAVAATHAATEAVPLTTGVKPGEQPGADAAAGKPLAAGDKTPTQTTPPVTAAKLDGAQGVAASALTPQAAPPLTSSDSMSTLANASIAASTTSDQPKSVDAKPATQDQPAVGDTSPHFDAQLSAQPPAQAVTSTTPAGSAQQPQPTYTSGMVSQQIVQVVAPLRSAKNGDYTLSLQLHPADLGAVTVRVEVQQGVLSVHMSAEHAHGHDALNQSLADLRTQLQSNGVRTGDIVVAAKPSVAPQHQDQQQQDQRQHTGGRHQQEAPMRNDTGDARRPGDRSSHHAPSQADDDALDVRI